MCLETIIPLVVRHSRNKRIGNSDMQSSITETELVNNRLEETRYVRDDELVNVLVDIAEGNETKNISVSDCN